MHVVRCRFVHVSCRRFLLLHLASFCGRRARARPTNDDIYDICIRKNISKFPHEMNQKLFPFTRNRRMHGCRNLAAADKCRFDAQSAVVMVLHLVRDADGTSEKTVLAFPLGGLTGS